MTIAYLDDNRSPLSSAHLGPATVVEMAGATPIVEIDGVRCRAEMALAFPYHPQVDDELLVISQGARRYVIGVLHAKGGVALRFLGDVQLHAVAGSLSLNGDRGVKVQGDEVSIRSKTLKVFAGNVLEKAEGWYRRVRGVLNVHAGEKRELVDGAIETRADKASTLTRGIVTINGKEVHLG